jgi:hypothetical protein
MKKYIENLEEKVSSVLNESLVADAAELVGIEEEDAEERIKGLSFANYIELGNAIDLEDAETAREILSTVAPIEEGKLAKAAAIGTMALGLGAAAADQGAHASTSADDPSWDGPHDVQMSTQRSIDQDDNLTDRSLSVKGPNKKGEYLVTYLDGEEIKRYVTKTPPSVNETASAGGTGAGGVASGGDGGGAGVTAANGYGGIGTWDGKKHKKPKAGLKKAGKGIYEDGSDTLYHVTHTKYVPQITKNGLRPMGAPSNWVQQGSGDRYGMGEIYVFTNYEDAKKWAGRMDWDFNQTIGSGEISIITLRYPEGQDFEKDEADPMSQAGQKGDWLKTYEPIGPENILNVDVFKSMKESMDLLDKPTLTVREIADKHGVPVADIASELAMGIQVELEHSNNRKVAKEIALDHLMELPDYYTKLDKMENESLDEADNPYAASPSQGSSVDALAQQTQTAEPTPTANDDPEKDNELVQRKEVDDLTVGDDIEVIDIDGDPTPVTVKTPRGPGDTLVVQTDKGEEHIVKKQAVSGTPTIQEMYEAAMAHVEEVEIDEEMATYESALTDRIVEVAPPGMEDWIKSRKPEFKKRYGKDWEKVLYATAWKQHNNESIEEDEQLGFDFDPKPEWGTRRGDILRVVNTKEGPKLKVKGMSALIGVGDWVDIDGYGQKILKIGRNGVQLDGDGRFHSIKKIRYPIDENIEEDKDEFVKKLQHGDRYFIRRSYHIGKKPYDDFEATIIDGPGPNGGYKVRFTDNNGEENVTWYPAPGTGRLSSRFYDEELIKGGERGKYVAGDSRNEWPAVGINEGASDFESLKNRVIDNEIQIAHEEDHMEFDPNRLKKLEAMRKIDSPKAFVSRYKRVTGATDWDLSDELNHIAGLEEARNATNTEHSGAKKGKGGYYGRKKDAKSDSNKKRRANDKKAVSEADLATHVNVEYRDPEGKFIIVHAPPAGYWAVGKGSYQHDIDRTAFDNFDDALDHAHNCLASLDESINEIRRLAGLKETASAGATGAGAIATAPAAQGEMIKRSPSIYDKPEPKKRKKESNDGSIGRAKKK